MWRKRNSVYLSLVVFFIMAILLASCSRRTSVIFSMSELAMGMASYYSVNRILPCDARGQEFALYKLKHNIISFDDMPRLLDYSDTEARAVPIGFNYYNKCQRLFDGSHKIIVISTPKQSQTDKSFLLYVIDSECTTYMMSSRVAVSELPNLMGRPVEDLLKVSLVLDQIPIPMKDVWIPAPVPRLIGKMVDPSVQKSSTEKHD